VEIMASLGRMFFNWYLKRPALASLVVLLVVGLLIAVKHNLLWNMFFGPIPVSKDYILNTRVVDDNLAISNVSFTGDSIYDSGFQYVVTTNGTESARNNVFFLAVNDKLLLVMRPSD
jgi:hypothetical protein